MTQEITNFLITIAPSIAGVIAMIFSFIMSIKKVSTIISEFRQSNELKQNNERISQLLASNMQLKKMNEKLLSELTRINTLEKKDGEQKN